LKKGAPESIEKLRLWLWSSEIGAEIAVAVAGSIVAGLRANYYPRPLLCVALDALDALDAFKIKVHDKELASQAEVSIKTEERAREERLYVRFSNLCTSPIESPYSDLL